MGKKADKTESERFAEIANDARETFDLGDFLRGRSVRTKTTRVFTDEVTAERRGGYEQITATLPNGLEVPQIRSWGLVKEIADAQRDLDGLDSKTTKEAKELKAKIATATAEMTALTSTLLETALEVELKAIPKVIKKDAYRAAKEALGIHGKINDTQAVDFIDEHNAQILKRTVVSITKHANGEKNAGISIESARALIDHLPDSEWAKINDTLKQLLDEKTIGDIAVSDPDF